MKTARKKLHSVLLLFALAAVLCGCAFSASVDDLYALPQMPEQFTDLEAQVNALIAEGAEYAAPTSGSNLQPVQMVDLDGDGQEEALIFMRNSADEKPLKIHVFKMRDNSCEEAAVLENSGTAIYSVAYSDLTGDGLPEILVGWRAGVETQALTVYQLKYYRPKLLLSTAYTRYLLDASPDTPGLILCRADSEEGSVAECYRASGEDEMTLCAKAHLSGTAAELSLGRTVLGTLTDGSAALFVTGISADNSIAMTDVLRQEADSFTNLTLNHNTGFTAESFPFIGLFPSDINGDGCTDVPVPCGAPLSSAEKTASIVSWRNYGSDGRAREAFKTYHDLSEGWYLVIPEDWGNISVSCSSGSDTYTSVSAVSEDGTEKEMLRIYKFEGENREVRAARDDRFILRSHQQRIYAAEFVSTEILHLGYREEDIRELFNLVVTEWLSGENG